MSSPFSRRQVLRGAAGLFAVAGAAALGGCVGGSAQPSSGGSGSGTTLHLVGFSVPKEANGAIEKQFAQTDAGKGVTWEESYGASGDQSRAVANGLKADFVNFSLEPDMTRLVDAGLVDAGWNSGATKGIVATSVVAIGVQKGNPLGIKGWDDLIKDGVKIITPNPASSGSAKWNILAAYHQVVANGGTEAEAQQYLTKFFGNVAALPGSGRDATNAFLQGAGNVLISYENEAILARQSGEDFEYIVPDATIKIENPAAITKAADPKAKDYLDFVLGSTAQQTYASKGFRPVVADTTIGTVEGAHDPANPFPVPAKLFTIAELGGWSEVNKKYFADKTGIVPQIQASTGKA